MGFKIPFGSQESSSSILLGLSLKPYNMPPWMCMKDLYMFLSFDYYCTRVKEPKAEKRRFLATLNKCIVDSLRGCTNLWCFKGAQFYHESAFADHYWFSHLESVVRVEHSWRKQSLSILYENLKAFNLPNGGKVSWFDCHR